MTADTGLRRAASEEQQREWKTAAATLHCAALYKQSNRGGSNVANTQVIFFQKKICKKNQL